MRKLLEKYWPPRWIATTLVVMAILYLTLVPKPLPDDTLPEIPGIDKLAHALMFGALALVATIDCTLTRRSRQFKPPKPRALFIIAAASAAFGAAIEVAQHLMQMGRGGDLIDLLADILGIIIAIPLARKILNLKKPYI